MSSSLQISADAVPTTAADYAANHEIPQATLKTDLKTSRPEIAGPDAPLEPFPIALAGLVQKGFGRGGKDLGCPTANLPDDSIAPLSTKAERGIYYGYAQVIPPAKTRAEFAPEDLIVLPMVMSLGWNPVYKNEKLTAEIHIIHTFPRDFYGDEIRAVVLGYIRPEFDYVSREGLIQDIEVDKKVALNSLKRPKYEIYSRDPHFTLSL